MFIFVIFVFDYLIYRLSCVTKCSIQLTGLKLWLSQWWFTRAVLCVASNSSVTAHYMCGIIFYLGKVYSINHCYMQLLRLEDLSSMTSVTKSWKRSCTLESLCCSILWCGSCMYRNSCIEMAIGLGWVYMGHAKDILTSVHIFMYAKTVLLIKHACLPLLILHPLVSAQERRWVCPSTCCWLLLSSCSCWLIKSLRHLWVSPSLSTTWCSPWSWWRVRLF